MRVVLGTVAMMILISGMVTAEVPEGVEQGPWAKVEAQLEFQGVRPMGAVAKVLPVPNWTVAPGSYFGFSTAVAGDLMVVGAYGEEAGSNVGAAYIFDRNEGGADTWGQIAKITASDGAGDDYFGYSVGISSDTVVVGAYGDDDNGPNSGSAYVYARDQGGADVWGQVAKISASDGADSNYFGRAVSINGDTVVVGAFGDDDDGLNSGSAYVFDRDQGGADTWGQVARISASDGAHDDSFGYSVAISGGTVVVGAPGDSDNGSDSGSAYVFDRNEGGVDGWVEVAKITASDGADDDYFSYSVSISGDTVVVGAYRDDDNGSDSGSATISDRNEDGADAWGQVTKKVAPDTLTARGDSFGYSVSISGDTVVVGAFGDDDNGLNSGSAYVFDRYQGGADTWGQVAKIAASDGASHNYFGYSVSISGDTVVVGAYGDDDNGGFSGSAYVFQRNEGGVDTWGQVAKIVASDGVNGDFFGYSVSISGDTVVVGAYGDDDNNMASGSAYVFGRNMGGADAWGQVEKITASDGVGGAFFGWAVAISGDTLVVGAWGDDDIGSDSGSAYVFGRNKGGADTWRQVAKIVASDGVNGDFFGYSVSISGDTVVVGAYGDDDNGSISGSAYVFDRDEGGADIWGQMAKITASDGVTYALFGKSVSISGDTVAAGADEEDGNGSAYVFGRDEGGADIWGQMAKMTASGGAGSDLFGYSVSISGATAVIGTPDDDDVGIDSGSASIFEYVFFADGFESGDLSRWDESSPSARRRRWR